ncbi:restriction endonuclease subunit S [Bacteroides graminisolvens]|uniref:restriction endonuclease subunit S n=1 Tax=Bacteroides graminisolvens TaxID=477666 RepID=UPI0024095860|nr:restriction endonuclease subunit S [Bacteroides graminisolvens]
MKIENKEIKRVVPPLRFPEFRDAEGWEVTQLHNLANRITRKNTHGTINRVLTNSASDGIVDQRDYFDKDIANQNNLEGYYVVEKGDYVYNPRISNIAPVGPLSKNRIGTGVMSPLYTVFRFDNKINDFYAQYFQSINWHWYLKEVSNQGVRFDRISITPSIFMDMPIPAPIISEQQKITDCLGSLDDLISAVTDKIEALKEYKKGLMQQLFPAEGKTTPTLRFPEFQNAGEWEEILLGSISTFINGRAYKQNELLESGKYRVLRVGNFFSNNNWYYSDLELEDNKYCTKGDLLYAWSASFGPRMWNEEKVIFHYHIWKVIEHKGISRDFLFTLLSHETERIKKQQAKGLGLLHITKEAIEGWKTRITKNILEQQKIANVLSSLDELISAETDKLDLLKTHKKGLMQQLFPTINK